MYVPEGYGTVFPYLIVDSADGLARFLVEVFDAEEEGRSVTPNGRVANIRVRIGTSKFMIGEAEGGTIKASPGTYYVYVDDVDKVFEKALVHGATAIFNPADMSYMDRQAGVTDPSGNSWWISTRLVDEPYDP